MLTSRREGVSPMPSSFSAKKRLTVSILGARATNSTPVGQSLAPSDPWHDQHFAGSLQRR